MITVMLDKKRHIRFPLNALEKFEDVTGLKIFDMPAPTEMTIKQFKAFLWAGLIHEDETLTIEQVGDMIDSGNLDKVTAAVNKVWAEVGETKRPL